MAKGSIFVRPKLVNILEAFELYLVVPHSDLKPAAAYAEYQ